MEKTDKGISHNSQLIYVGRKDTTRLLEAYVKRSISLNEGSTTAENLRTRPRRSKTISGHDNSSDISNDSYIHLKPSSCEDGAPELRASEPKASEPKASEPVASEPKASEPKASEPKASDEVPAVQPKTSAEEEKGEKEGKKKSRKKSRKKSLQKRSFWRDFLGIFSSKESPPREEVEPSPEKVVAPPQQAPSPVVASSQRRSKLKKRFSKKRLSFRIPSKKDLFRDSVRGSSPAVDATRVEPVVDPLDSYYEKVSEELEKIVHEAQEPEVLSNDEVIDRIIALMKQQGDAIDDKLKENPSISAFFQRLSYSSFQQLADTYVETESPGPPDHPTVPHTAPELVKLAFTLDFTARVAGLSRQATGYITGLGNRYLEERFSYATQAIPDSHNDLE